MRQLFDTVWQRQGTSWIWDEDARNQVCSASEVWSLRQFMQTVGKWPAELPGNNGRTLVVAGLDGSLDLLTPQDAEAWLGDVIKSAILSFQDEYGCEASLMFWLPMGRNRIEVQITTDEVKWLCEAPFRESKLDFGRLLWGQANEYPQEIFLKDRDKSAGLFHKRIT